MSEKTASALFDKICKANDLDMPPLMSAPGDRGTGNLTIELSDGNEFYLPVMDLVTDCRGRSCRLHHKCPEQKGSKYPCGIQLKYLVTVSAPYIDIIQETGDLILATHVCTRLLPLHLMQCMLQMELMVVKEPMVKDRTGRIHPHPVFAELRHTIAQIRCEWTKSPLFGTLYRAGGYRKRVVEQDFASMDINKFFTRSGKAIKYRFKQVGYYDQMASDDSVGEVSPDASGQVESPA